mmetsp:Transcript_1597/g.5638  ORF Transcript_1597/g.5638 Transcript_1597/m.5638 type:complete len:248 (-) Transcript_1597:73-816(-)
MAVLCRSNGLLVLFLLQQNPINALIDTAEFSRALVVMTVCAGSPLPQENDGHPADLVVEVEARAPQLGDILLKLPALLNQCISKGSLVAEECHLSQELGCERVLLLQCSSKRRHLLLTLFQDTLQLNLLLTQSLLLALERVVLLLQLGNLRCNLLRCTVLMVHHASPPLVTLGEHLHHLRSLHSAILSLALALRKVQCEEEIGSMHCSSAVERREEANVTHVHGHGERARDLKKPQIPPQTHKAKEQ